MRFENYLIEGASSIFLYPIVVVHILLIVCTFFKQQFCVINIQKKKWKRDIDLRNRMEAKCVQYFQKTCFCVGYSCIWNKAINAEEMEF